MQFPRIYQTNDTVLATALFLCGVPIATHEDGRPFPQLMLYDPDSLRRHGYRGMDFVEAASLAMSEKKAGIRVYQFQRTPELEEIIKAFRTAENMHEAGRDIDLPNVDPGDVAKILAMAKHIRSVILSDFKGPALAVSSEKVQMDRDEKDSASKMSGKFFGTIKGSFSATPVPVKR